MIEFDEDEPVGRDYLELVNKWDLDFEVDCAEGAINELRDLGVDIGDLEVDYLVIQRHILECVEVDDNGNQVIIPELLADIKEFLESLIMDKNTPATDAAVLDVILDLSKEEDHSAFLRWFVHCLPLMWN